MTFLDEWTGVVRRAAREVGPAVVALSGGGRGCGFLAGDGQVLTNAHNVGAERVEVFFADGREATGTVAGVDAEADLAVVSVDTAGAGGPEWAPPGDVGAPVLSVAYLGRGGVHVTSGLVSATGQSFRGPRGRRVEDAFEHTAPLRPGSSGSPVLDVGGRVVGLNTSRVSGGLYLAVTADDRLRAAADALARGDSPQRPQLGVSIAPRRWAAGIREAAGLPPREGLLIRDADPHGPAGRAGIGPGDLIVAASGRRTTRVDDLHAALDALGDGDALTLELVRGVEERSVDVRFGGDPA
jgi:S1-C subfamily serine protease